MPQRSGLLRLVPLGSVGLRAVGRQSPPLARASGKLRLPPDLLQLVQAGLQRVHRSDETLTSGVKLTVRPSLLCGIDQLLQLQQVRVFPNDLADNPTHQHQRTISLGQSEKPFVRLARGDNFHTPISYAQLFLPKHRPSISRDKLIAKPSRRISYRPRRE